MSQCKGILLSNVLILLISTQAFALSDPTRPAFFQEAKVSQPFRQHALSAIIIHHSVRLARLDGKLITEGQKIGDSQVVSINANSVQLDTPSGRITVFLSGESVRKPAMAAPIMDGQGSKE